jgi:hypothetical protein
MLFSFNTNPVRAFPKYRRKKRKDETVITQKNKAQNSHLASMAKVNNLFSMQSSSIFFPVKNKQKVAADPARSNKKGRMAVDSTCTTAPGRMMPKQRAIARKPRLVTPAPEIANVANFRASVGCQNIYRSARLDTLGNLLAHSAPLEKKEPSDWLEPDRKVLFDATLIVDLRMEDEIEREIYESLTRRAPGGPFQEATCLEDLTNSEAKRQHFRPCGEHSLTKAHCLAYTGKVWVPSRIWDHADQPQKKELMVQELNKRGLLGLYEIILETKPYICNVLQAITIHLGKHPNGEVVYHCSIGKDRTGVIAMLLGKILGSTDSEICDDFAESISIRELAEIKFREMFGPGVDVIAFSLSTKETMQGTIDYVETNYGSVSQYLHTVGFDSEWQSRFRKAVSRV